jgi:aminopeptidase-like protein
MADRMHSTIGEEMYSWAEELFPIHRSLSGPGVRETLAYIKGILPRLTVHEVPSGTPAFDWTVPDEWVVRDAYIADEADNRVVDVRRNNLHIVGYSEPVDTYLELPELQKRLYSLPDQPEAIPYVTSYYERRWGFCLSEVQRRKLKPGRYHVVVDADLGPGVMNYGELLLPGREEGEVLLSTYICHPSMANNELSGPVVATALARALAAMPDRRYSYRIVFVPETIGAILYLSRNAAQMKARTVAGFVLTCVGDDRQYSYMPSRRGTTLADRVALHVLRHHAPDFVRYSFLDRASDERQYCSPLIDLPVASIMRTRYKDYPEYHTSLDDLSVISPTGLQGAYEVYRACLDAVECNRHYGATLPCEPQLGRRGLHDTLSRRGGQDRFRRLKHVLAYADGETDLLSMAELIGCPVAECAAIAQILEREGLLREVEAVQAGGKTV